MEQSSHRPRVVVAEDFVLLQESIRLAIQRDCEIVAYVEDGEAALEAVTKHSPDVLLLDVSLPRLGGFQVAEKLKEISSPVRVIFITSYNDKDYVARAFEIGVKGYVLKSALQVELLTAIRQVSSGAVYQSPGLS